MIRKFYNYLHDLRALVRINIATSKGAIAKNKRVIKTFDPNSWEFSGFSQNGEDGIIDFLVSHLSTQNKYVIEIGAADGIQNNSSWLVVVHQYRGLMIDGNPVLVQRAKQTIQSYSIGAEYVSMIVDRKSGNRIKDICVYSDPDVLSIDIDGIDYYVLKSILDSGLKPKILVVEYNSAFGPDKSLTIEYKDGFDFNKASDNQLYYGVSIAGWRRLLGRYGYKFITVESKGVNAFFVDEKCFDNELLKEIRGYSYRENIYQLLKFRATHEEQYAKLLDQRFYEII